MMFTKRFPKAEWDEDEEEWFPRCGAVKRHHKTEWQIEDSTDNIPTDRRKCHDSGCWAEEWDSLIDIQGGYPRL